MEELQQEHDRLVREEIVKVVRRRCDGCHYARVWKELYMRFELEYSPLPTSNKLDWIANNGYLGKLLRIAKEL